MFEPNELRRQLTALLDEDTRCRDERQRAGDRERRELDKLRNTFEHTVRRWLVEWVVPRLEVLVESLPATGLVERSSASLSARATFPWNAEFPVAAALSITIAPTNHYREMRVEIEPQLIPMLRGHPEPTVRECEMSHLPSCELIGFIDHAIIAFARSYLDVRNPDSPYQRCRGSRTQAALGSPMPRARVVPESVPW